MAKFIYKMANVLDIKLKMEDQAKTAFAEAMAELNSQEEKLRLLRERKGLYEEKGRNLRSSNLYIQDIRENDKAIEVMKELEIEQIKQVKLAEKKMEHAREALNVAIQERKIQEKLKENAFEEFKMELNAAESKEVDELVSYRFGLKAAEAQKLSRKLLENE